jgi:hypothetical protein
MTEPFATWEECKAAIEAFDEKWSDEGGWIDVRPGFDWAHVVFGEWDISITLIDRCFEDYFEAWVKGVVEGVNKRYANDEWGIRFALILLGKYLDEQAELIERIRASDMTEWEMDDD